MARLLTFGDVPVGRINGKRRHRVRLEDSSAGHALAVRTAADAKTRSDPFSLQQTSSPAPHPS